MPPRRGVDICGRRRREAGFSLVEVMAALAILAIAMTAVFATFVTQQKSFTAQSQVSEMQQNLRDAVEYVTRDLRMAGYGLHANLTIPNNLVAAGVTSLRSLYAVDNTVGPDQIYVLYAFDMDASQPPTNLSAPMPNVGDALSVVSIAGFANSDLVLVTDNTSTADLFLITGAPAGGVLPHATGAAAPYNYNDAGSHSWPAGGYLLNPAAAVVKARFVRYFIQTWSDVNGNPHPTLMVDRMNNLPAQPVADDIEDMQLTYGRDTDADGAVDTWTDQPSYAQLSQVRQIRLMLQARSRLPDREWNETRLALGNHPGAGAPDGYRRRIIDVVIDVRNSGAP